MFQDSITLGGKLVTDEIRDFFNLHMSTDDIDKAIEEAVISNDREDTPPQEREELKTNLKNVSRRCKKESMIVNSEFSKIESN